MDIYIMYALMRLQHLLRSKLHNKASNWNWIIPLHPSCLADAFVYVYLVFILEIQFQQLPRFDLTCSTCILLSASYIKHFWTQRKRNDWKSPRDVHQCHELQEEGSADACIHWSVYMGILYFWKPIRNENNLKIDNFQNDPDDSFEKPLSCRLQQ